MPRQLRLEYAGAIYHLINRGDRREPVFRDDQDCQRFLETLGEACEKTGWQVHAYCLMGNHFHLVVETPQANLVAGMKWLLGTYTMRFNRRHGVSGHLFAGRYKSLLVDGSGHGYLRTVCDYVHLNPSRAKLLAPEQSLRAYAWSSFGLYLTLPEQRPVWLRADRVFGEAGIVSDNAAGRREFEGQIEARRAAESSDDWRLLRRGWCYGKSDFRDDLVKQVRGIPGASAPELMREAAEDKAESILRTELARRRWQESNLAARRKGDPEKIQIARRLRRETTVTLKWIAARLQMGSWTYLANLISATNGSGAKAVVSPVARKQRSPAVKSRATRGLSQPKAEPVSGKIDVPPVMSIVAEADRVAPEEDILPLHCL